MRLILEVSVSDEQVLLNAARDRHAYYWGDENWIPADAGEAVYELIVASRPQLPFPEAGIELLTATHEVIT